MQLARQTRLPVSSRLRAAFSRASLLLFGLLFMLACGYQLSASLRPADNSPGLPITPIVVTTIPFVLGTLIKRQHPAHIIGTFFLVMAISSAAGEILGSLGHFNATRAVHYSPLLNTVTLTSGHFLWVPGVFVPLFLMPLYFPDGKLLSPRWQPVMWAVVFIQAWYAVGVIFRPWPWPAFGVFDTRSWNGITGSEPFFEAMTPVITAITVIAFPFVVLSVVLRYRQSDSHVREQMKWPLVGLAGAIGGGLLQRALPALADWDFRYGYVYTWTIAMLFPVSVGVAILKHRLWDVELVVNRALVYTGLTALIVIVYLLVVTAFGALFQAQVNTLGGLVATAVVALLFQPARDRLQRTADRLLHGERNDPAAVLTRLAAHLETAPTLDAILPGLVQSIAGALSIPYVAIWLPGAGGEMEPAAVFGRAYGHFETIPLSYRQELIGRLVVSPRAGYKQFEPGEKALLATIAMLSAPTVRAVQLSEEVSRSRRRIVSAREDERRRLRRDLHDDLGPQLASQTLGLEAVSQLMESDPHKAQALLDRLKEQSEEAIRDVRRVVYNLRPPALDDLGLVGALQQIATGYQTSGLRVQLDVPATRLDLPAAIETAVYRIAHEAMTNVVRHADASRCNVRLDCDQSHVIVEVRDDGCGLPADYCAGVGVIAMRERAAELDGELLLAPLPDGGILVRARLPLAVPDA